MQIDAYPCLGCDSGPPVIHQDVEGKNADFLGFTEAKVFHETKDTWKKV